MKTVLPTRVTPMTDSIISNKTMEKLLDEIDPEIGSILKGSIAGKRELSTQDAIKLFQTTGFEFQSLLFVADFIRKKIRDAIVTFVINRNINFTNICTARCQFCAFSVTASDPEAFFLKDAEILKRANEAVKTEATELCIQ